MRQIRSVPANVRILDLVTKYVAHVVGTPNFFLVQGIWIVMWLGINSGRTSLPIFDPYPYHYLRLVLAIEGIVLLLFVFLNQQRINRLRRRLAEYDATLHHKIRERPPRTAWLQ